MPTRIVLLAAIAATHAIAVPGRTEDWPTYRHDRLRTASTDERLEPPLELVWTFHARTSRLAPAPTLPPNLARAPWLSRYALPITAAGDSVFFTSRADGRIVCLDAANGRTRWEFHAGAAVNCTAMIWRGKVYAGSDDGFVYALDARTGRVVWRFRAAPADRWLLSYGRPASVWPVRTDVVVVPFPEGGRPVAYFGAGIFPHDGTFLYAVDARDGEMIWRNGSQCESGWRAALAPAGHLFLSQKTIWVPRDVWGYFTNWGSLCTFERASGRCPPRVDPGTDPDGPLLRDPFYPLLGVRIRGVRHLGYEAATIDPGDPGKVKDVLWRQAMPGRWTDVDSILSVRNRDPVFFRWDPDLSTVIHAGGVIYHTAFELDPAKGSVTGIYARAPEDGELLWSADVPGEAHQIIVANGRLFAATRRGTIHCFAPKGAERHGTIEEVVDPAPFGEGREASRAFSRAAEAITEETGVKVGHALVVDCESGQLAYDLARRTECHLIAIFRDAEKAASARAAYARANLHVSRIIAYCAEDEAALPFPSFFADLIVSESHPPGDPPKDAPGRAPSRDPHDLNRMLKPIRGISLAGGTKFVRPPLDETGGWTHTLGDAGHTSSSHDGALKPPLGVLWYGTPHMESSIDQPARILDGVAVILDPDALIACDQYTGRELWRYPTAGVNVTQIAAASRSLFVPRDGRVVRLDLWSGRLQREYETPFEGGRWGQLACPDDGAAVYGTASGEKWSGMFAIDAVTGRPLWKRGGPGREAFWGGWSALSDGRIYILGGAAEGDRREEGLDAMRAYLAAHDRERLDAFEKERDQRDVRILVAIDSASGAVLYERGADVTNCGGRFLPKVDYGSGRYARHYNPSVGAWVMAHGGVVVLCTQSGADKGWGVWPRGGYRQRGIAVHDGATGALLWNKECNYRTRPVIADETIYAEPWAYDLRTGERRSRIHPITGEPADWAWCRVDKQCGLFSASRHFLFGRSLGVGYQDLLNDEGLYTFFQSRMSCSFDAVSGGGTMIKPPQAVYCRCSWSLPFTVAMGEVPSQPAIPMAFAQPGRHLPVEHLRLDCGATGDRRDAGGNLWLATRRPVAHPLLLSNDVYLAYYPGGEDLQRSAVFTAIEDTDTPFVFATAIRGLKRAVIPVTTPRDGKAEFLVKLGFAAPPGDRPGQRVFDVRLDGRPVLEDFDILRETGGADRAIWKTFRLPLDGDLVLDLVAPEEEPAPDAMPLLNGIAILRERVTTLGVAVTGDPWLCRTRSEASFEVALANLRAHRFRGRLIFDAPEGLALAALGDTIELEPGARTDVSVHIEAAGELAIGAHAVAVKLIGDGGTIEAERSFRVDWLDDLERCVLQGGSACLIDPALADAFGRRVSPALNGQRLHVAPVSGKEGEGGAVSYVWFSIPDEIRGRIRRARLSLHAARELRSMQAAVRHGNATSGGSWGVLKQLAGPPWPDINEIKYPQLPATRPGGAPLVPVAPGATEVTADLTGSLDAVTESDQVWLAIEPAGPGGGVYWSHQAHDATKRPVLIADWAPRRSTASSTRQ